MTDDLDPQSVREALEARALHLARNAADMKPGDEVVTVRFTDGTTYIEARGINVGVGHGARAVAPQSAGGAHSAQCRDLTAVADRIGACGHSVGTGSTLADGKRPAKPWKGRRAGLGAAGPGRVGL